MTAAFLETTVLTNLLLKKDGSEIKAKALLETFSSVHVPQFAWKEFKRGPLNNFRWAHDKLAETKSFVRSMIALQRLSRTQQRYLTSTAIEALITAFAGTMKGLSLKELGKKYDQNVDMDVLAADAMRLHLKKLIFLSWGQRNKLFGGQRQPLPCYPDRDIVDTKPLLDLRPRDCPSKVECCLKSELVQRTADVAKCSAALPTDDKRNETVRRRQFLRQIEKRPQTEMRPRQCQQFGDAYFVLFCPKDAVVVTTNGRDINPMADALSIKVANPNDDDGQTAA